MNQTTNNVTDLPVEQANEEPQPPQYGGTPATLDTFEPWPEPVNGSIIDDYANLLSRFMFMKKREALILALWVVHANCYDVFKVTPRLLISAGTNGCGKSNLMMMLQASVNQSRLDTDSTPSAFFTMSQNGGAFFLDEADEWVAGRSESKGAVLNTLRTGFNRNGRATRTDMSSGRVVMEFPTHASVAISGISLTAKKLGNALMERCHVINLKLALQGDVQVEFDDRFHLPLFVEMGRKLLRLGQDNKDAFATYERRGTRPIPTDLINRRADCWEPFFAIAVALGGNWYERILKLIDSEPQKLDEGGSPMFWEATNEILTDLRASGYEERFIQAAQYAKLLAEWVDENGIRPYAEYHNVFSMDGKKIQANDLYDFLRPYDIFSTQRKTKSGKNRRGFLILELMDAVDRHAPKDDESSKVAHSVPLQEVSA